MEYESCTYYIYNSEYEYFQNDETQIMYEYYNDELEFDDKTEFVELEFNDKSEFVELEFDDKTEIVETEFVDKSEFVEPEVANIKSILHNIHNKKSNRLKPQKWSIDILKMNTKQLNKFIIYNKLTSKDKYELKKERRRSLNRMYAHISRNKKQ
jgi:hypothetical protein